MTYFISRMYRHDSFTSQDTEFSDTLPLISPGASQRPQNFIERWGKIVDEFRDLWPLVWPDEHKDLHRHVVLCGLLFLLQRLLYILVPYLLGKLAEDSSKKDEEESISWILLELISFLVCKFAKDYLCKELQSLHWRKVANRTEESVTSKTLRHICKVPEEEKTWATGGFLSDFNKGSSLNALLEETVFKIIPTIFDLLTTTIFLWNRLGTGYGCLTWMLSVFYMYYAIRTVQISLPWKRDTVTLKRDKDAVAKEICDSVLQIVEKHALEEEVARFKKAQGVFHYQQIKAAWSIFFRSIPPNVVFYLGFLVMIGIVFSQMRIGRRSVKDFLTLLTFMEQLLAPLNSLSSSLQAMQNAFVNTERVKKTQEVQPLICDQANAVRLKGCDGLIEFDSVQCRTLKGMTFRCELNTVTAILGISTSERLVFWHLLFRLIDPTAGRIFIDRRNVRDYEIATLRRHVGMVHQSCELRDGTIMQNIKYGLTNPDSIPEKKIFGICQKVNIHHRILKLPGGYSCPVGRNGHSLDVEATRRLDLARLLLQNPEIIVFDQVLLPLEGEPEEELQRVLEAISYMRTIVLLDDRIAAVKSADKILLLLNGELVESGTHTELLSLGGHYQGMWAKQLVLYGGIELV